MSGTNIPLMARGIDPTAAYQGFNTMLKTGAEVGETQARTGLIGQQAIGAGIANQLSGLSLDIQKQLYGPLMTSGAASSEGPLPWAPAAAGGQTGADIARGGQPGIGLFPSTAEPASGQPAPAIGGGTPAIGGGQSTAPQGPAQTSANGVLYPGLGVPVPRLWALGIVQAQNKQEAISKALQDRRLAIGQLVTGAFGADGKADPQAWNQAVRTAYDQGFIDNRDAWRFYGHPDLAQGLVTSLVAPENQPSVRGQQAGAAAQAEVGPAIQRAAGEAAARTPFEIVDVPQRNADGTYSTVQMSKAEALQHGVTGNAQTGASLANPNTPMTGGAWSTRVRAGENPGGNPAQTNTSGPGGTPASSAVGDGQFINDTWLDVLKRNRPDLARGKSDTQLLGMRTDANLSDQMIQAYGKENAGALAAAGKPVNALTIGMAHALGPDGAVAVLSAPGNAPLGRILPANVIAANPTLGRQTVGGMVNDYKQRFGTGSVDFTAGAGAGPVTPPGAIAAGPPTPTKAQGELLGLNTKQIEQDAKYVGDLHDEQANANITMQNLLHLRDIGAGLPTGAMGDVKATLANYFQSFGPQWVNKFVSATTGLDPSKAGDWQEVQKQALLIAGQAENKAVGARGSFNLTRLYLRSLPGAGTQPMAFQDMMNLFLVQQQYGVDHAQAAAENFNSARQAYTGDLQQGRVSNYEPMSAFDKQYYAPGGPHDPKVYLSAVKLLNGRVPGDQAVAGLTRDQIAEAAQVALRVDPAGRLPHFAPTGAR